MGSISKSFSLLLVLILAVSSLIIAKPAFAQTPTPSSVPISTPSVPEFTVKFVDSSYNVPTTSSIDPYTGQNITNQGYHVENRTIELTIKNQPFNSYIANGQNISFYFNVREKGHYAENWTIVYSPDLVYPTESNSDYTVISYSLDENVYPFWNDVSSGGQVDFQVQTMIGYVSRVYNPNANGNQLDMYPWEFTGETSSWSPTQTVTIPANSTSASTSPNLTSTPTAPEFPSLTIPIIILVLVVVIVSLLLYMKKRRTA